LYLARIYVTLKPVVNDPQGQTILGSLKTLGFGSVEDVRFGKYLEVRVNESDQPRAEAVVSEMCRRLLANPVIEEFRFDLAEDSQPYRPGAPHHRL
jgi:phosphoribosylformylglycinamidine synthase